MNLRNKNKFRPEVSTSSLSDIMFFLMLFFLIMSTMISPSVIKLTLPKSQYNQKIQKVNIAISITKDLKYYINNSQVEFNQLENGIKSMSKASAEQTIVIRCEDNVPVQKLVDVMQIGNKLKIKMILATKSPNG
jgi:biopolymer transport protein ExbD